MIILVINKTGEVELFSSDPQAVIIVNVEAIKEKGTAFFYEQSKPIAPSKRTAVKQALDFARLHEIEDPQ